VLGLQFVARQRTIEHAEDRGPRARGRAGVSSPWVSVDDEDTDDSVLRAVAAAPPRPPPRTEPSRTHIDRPPRAVAVKLVIAVAVAAAVVGIGWTIHEYAAPVGDPVSAWTLDVTGGPHDVRVTLPTNLYDQMQLRETDYTLATDLALTAEQRAHTLTLGLDCFHAPLALAIDGVPIADAGDVKFGEHRYVIDAALAGREHLHLVLAARHDLESGLGFGVAPRLSIGVAGRSGVATLNRYTTLVALVLAALFAFVFGVLAMLDRQHREYLAFFVGMVATVVVCLYLLGELPTAQATLLGRLAGPILGVCGATMFTSMLFFLHLAFGLGRPPRILLALWAVFVVLVTAAPFSNALLVASGAAFALGALSTLVYLVVRCLRFARAGVHRHEARILLAWAFAQVATSAIENTWRISGVHHAGGFHLVSASIVLLALSQATVLVTQLVARQRTIEHTADELRRQVAERSKDLAVALTTLAQQPQAFAPGRLVDERYRVIGPLGAGGMGTVYEVERVGDHVRLALKTLRDRVDVKLMARFAREAQFAAELRHPNLVPVIDVGIADGALYMVLELIDGGSLADLRDRFGDPAWAKPVLAQVATGLAAIHARAIVHRDLKPSNVLMSRGVARIADFGLASLRVDEQVGALDDTTPHSPLLTRASEVFGTPAYMAPELGAGAKNAAPSSDIFSFGVIAHELLVGRPPFQVPAVLSRLNGDPLVAPAMDELEPALRSLVTRCLDVDPAKRPTADELVAMLRG